jgi:hypothetical protein
MIQDVVRGTIHTSELEYALQEGVAEGLGYSQDPEQAKWYHEGRKAFKGGTTGNLIQDIAKKHGCPPEWLKAFHAGYQDQEGWGKEDMTEGYQLDEGIMDSINGLVSKIKAVPGIQKFIQTAQAKKDELINAAQHSRNGTDLVKNIQAVVGGQQAVAEGWGDKIAGGLVAGAGGSLMAAGAELFMRAWNAMGQPDLTSMTASGNYDGRIVLALTTMLVLVGALALFGGGAKFKQGLEQDAQPMREGQADLDTIKRLVGL